VGPEKEPSSDWKDPRSESSSDSHAALDVWSKQYHEADHAGSLDGPNRFLFGELDLKGTFFPDSTEAIQGTAADMHGTLLVSKIKMLLGFSIPFHICTATIVDWAGNWHFYWMYMLLRLWEGIEAEKQ
jgi:hypothetical protein